MYALLPDLDAVLVAFLKTHPALLPLHSGRAGTKLAAGEAPALRVTSLGGPQPWPWEAVSEYQIESWGGDQRQAKTLARTVGAAVYDLIGPIEGGHITGVSVQLAHLWLPDEETARPRYRTDIALTVMP